MKAGTPKTLIEAIENALDSDPGFKPYSQHVHAHIKDLLAQKFGVVMLASPECADVVKKLFDEIVKAPVDERNEMRNAFKNILKGGPK